MGSYFVECHIKSRTRISDASVCMDYYTALFTKAQDGHKVHWDSQKQAARQVFTTSIRFKIWLLMPCKLSLLQSDWWSQIWDQSAPCDKKCCSECQTHFAHVDGLGTRSVCRTCVHILWLPQGGTIGCNYGDQCLVKIIFYSDTVVIAQSSCMILN